VIQKQAMLAARKAKNSADGCCIEVVFVTKNDKRMIIYPKIFKLVFFCLKNEDE